jgi:hypothetical protein
MAVIALVVVAVLPAIPKAIGRDVAMKFVTTDRN